MYAYMVANYAILEFCNIDYIAIHVYRMPISLHSATSSFTLSFLMFNFLFTLICPSSPKRTIITCTVSSYLLSKKFILLWSGKVIN